MAHMGDESNQGTLDPSELKPRDRRKFGGVEAEIAPGQARSVRRIQRSAAVIARRQPDLTVVLENVHDPHNIAAVLRSCDAVGAMTVHVVMTREPNATKKFSRKVSGSAAKWIEVVEHDSIEDCYRVLRQGGFQVLATALGKESVDLYHADMVQPVALVLGNEMDGLSDAAIDGADRTVFIPMMGMVESVNISVAASVALFEALRQRLAAGRYAEPQLDEGTRAQMLVDWLKR